MSPADPPPSTYPKPTHFLVRPVEGTIVPLLPLDELPPHIIIKNVPRNMAPEATLGMLSLGIVPGSGGFVDVGMRTDGKTTGKIIKIHSTSQPQSINTTFKNTTQTPDSTSPPSQQPQPHTQPPKKAQEPDPAPSTPPRTPSPQPSTPPPAPSSPGPRHSHSNSTTTHPHTSSKPSHSQTSPQPAPRTPSQTTTSPTIKPLTSSSPTKTELCRHWCTHGICKWGQNCRYRHIMPMTRPGLAEVGLSDWPHWYRDVNPDFFGCATIIPSSKRKERIRKMGGCCSGIIDGQGGKLRDVKGRGAGGGGGGMMMTTKAGKGGEMGNSNLNSELGEQIIERLRILHSQPQTVPSASSSSSSSSSPRPSTSAITATSSFKSLTPSQLQNIARSKMAVSKNATVTNLNLTTPPPPPPPSQPPFQKQNKLGLDKSIGANGTLAIERAAARDSKRWEDTDTESESEIEMGMGIPGAQVEDKNKNKNMDVDVAVVNGQEVGNLLVDV